jgi:hypothetical protein
MKRLLLFTLFIFIWTNGFSFDLNKYLSKTSSFSNDEFIKNFPYSEYLKSVEFTDFKTIQHHRYLIYKYRDVNDNIGDRFVYQLAEKFLAYYPINQTTLKLQVNIAESYLRAQPNINDNANQIYKITGYYLLGQIARRIESDMQHNKFDPKKAENLSLIKRLNGDNVSVSIEPSKVDKVMSNVKSGNYSYITDRILLTIKGFLYPLAIWLSFDVSSLLNIIVVVIILMLIISSTTRKLSVVLILLIFASPFILKGEKAKVNITKAIVPKMKLSKIRTISKGVDIYKLKEKNKTIGQVIFMNRLSVKANYLATGNVYKKFLALRNKKHVVMASAGGFTNQKGFPLGLTIENGQISNPVLRHDRDGLIMVTKTGGIRVLNLKRKTFKLPGLGKPINNPQNSLLAYSDLINWATKYGATIFQVQLLSYSDQLLIDSRKAPNQLRERRILVLFSNKKSGEVHHAIFNIESAYNLAKVTEEIYAIISSRNNKVEAILNLDVGTYNIMNVFDRNGQILNNIRGPVDISTATNLLVYTE